MLDRAKGKTEAKAALRAGLRVGANIFLKEAKARVPVDTGRLKSSLRVKAPKRSRKFKDDVRLMVTSSKSNNLFTGQAYYGGMVEYGTVKMAAKPFIRPAFKAKQEEAVKAIGSKVGSEVEKRMKGK